MKGHASSFRPSPPQFVLVPSPHLCDSTNIMAAVASSLRAVPISSFHPPKCSSLLPRPATAIPLPLLQLRSARSLLAQPPISLCHLLCPIPSFAAFAASAAYSDAYDDDGDYSAESASEERDYEPRQQPPRSSLAVERGRLYVGNLPFSMTSGQLAEVFGEAGTVDSVEVVYDRVTERSRGFAFVTMTSVDEANEAIRMFDGSQIGGRTVKVNFPEVPRGGEREVAMGQRMRGASRGLFVDSPYKVYTGNLSWSVTSQALRDAFATQTGILGAKVIFDRDTGRSRGFGFVSFASAEECQAAIEAMDGVEVEGRPMRLSLAEVRPDSGTVKNSVTEAYPQDNFGY